MLRSVRRIGAAAVIGAVLMGVAGCGDGIHPKKYRDFALEQLDAIEYDESEFKKIKEKQQMEGAVVYVTDVKSTLEPYDTMIKETSLQLWAVKKFNMSSADFESYEIKDATYVEYRDEIKGGDFPEHSLMSVMYRFEDQEQALAAFEDYLDRMKDWTGADFEELEDWEYDLDEDSYEGHFGLVLSGDNLKDQIKKNIDKKYHSVGLDPTGLINEVNDYCDSKYRVAGFTYLKGRTVTIVLAESWDGDDSYIAPFCEYFYMDNVFEEENSRSIYSGLVDANFGSVMLTSDD